MDKGQSDAAVEGGRVNDCTIALNVRREADNIRKEGDTRITSADCAAVEIENSGARCQEFVDRLQFHHAAIIDVHRCRRISRVGIVAAELSDIQSQ